MKKTILLLILITFTTSAFPVYLGGKVDFFSIKKGTSPYFIEFTLASAMQSLQSNDINTSIKKLDEALTVYKSFSEVLHPYSTHMAGGLFIFQVYSLEKIPEKIITHFKQKFTASGKQGIFLHPYDKVTGYITMEILELEKEKKYTQALQKIDQALKILKNSSFFNFNVEQIFINELIPALKIKKADLLFLSGKTRESIKLYETFSPLIKAHLSSIAKMAKERFKKVNASFLFDENISIDYFFYLGAMMNIRVKNFKQAQQLINQGLKFKPDSETLILLSKLLNSL